LLPRCKYDEGDVGNGDEKGDRERKRERKGKKEEKGNVPSLILKLDDL
jgi:hypothetical protein